MGALERRCRLLLRAYPAAYRSERGEEIIVTLLEATPAGRAWPVPRDVRGLLTGGMRARAAQNRERTTAENLRVAALVGVAAYLALTTTGVLNQFVRQQIALGWQSEFSAYGWPLAAGMVLMLVTVALVWLSGRRGVVLCGALTAAAAVSYGGPWGSGAAASDVSYLACLAAMVGLASGRCRPGWRWLGPVGLAAAVPLLPAVAGPVLIVAVLLAVAVLGLVWMAVDARPALALAAFLLAEASWPMIHALSTGTGFFDAVPSIAIVAVITAPALWLLRRQSAHPSGPSAGLTR